MSRWRWILLLLVSLFSGLFAYLNGGERTTLHLGFTTLYQLSLVALVFGAFLLGMIMMFIITLRYDLRMRRLLRQRNVADPRGAEEGAVRQR